MEAIARPWFGGRATMIPSSEEFAHAKRGRFKQPGSQINMDG
jgi:hypothetical protein